MFSRPSAFRGLYWVFIDMNKRALVICISCILFSACSYETEYREVKQTFTSFLSAVQVADREKAANYAPFIAELSAEQLEQSFQYYGQFSDDSVLINYNMKDPRNCVVTIRVQAEEIQITIKKIDKKTWHILPDLTINYYIDEIQL